MVAMFAYHCAGYCNVQKAQLLYSTQWNAWIRQTDPLPATKERYQPGTTKCQMSNVGRKSQRMDAQQFVLQHSENTMHQWENSIMTTTRTFTLHSETWLLIFLELDHRCSINYFKHSFYRATCAYLVKQGKEFRLNIKLIFRTRPTQCSVFKTCMWSNLKLDLIVV